MRKLFYTYTYFYWGWRGTEDAYTRQAKGIQGPGPGPALGSYCLRQLDKHQKTIQE